MPRNTKTTALNLLNRVAAVATTREKLALITAGESDPSLLPGLIILLARKYQIGW